MKTPICKCGPFKDNFMELKVAVYHTIHEETYLFFQCSRCGVLERA